jgi:hypothetical protein
MARDSDAERERQRKEDEERIARHNELLKRAEEIRELQKELDRRHKSQWN